MPDIQKVSEAVCNCVNLASNIMAYPRYPQLALCSVGMDPTELVSSAVLELSKLLPETGKLIEPMGRQFIGLCNAPPKAVAGLNGASYHEIGFRFASKVLDTVCYAVGPKYWDRSQATEGVTRFDVQGIRDEWSSVKEKLEQEAPGVDAAELLPLIRDESVRAERQHGGKGTGGGSGKGRKRGPKVKDETQQRADFIKPRIESGEPWPDVLLAYHEEYPDDKGSDRAIQLAYARIYGSK